MATDTMTDAALLETLGDNGAEWAAAFRATALKLGYADMDEGWLIGWFANCIERSSQVRRERAERDRRGFELRGTL